MVGKPSRVYIHTYIHIYIYIYISCTPTLHPLHPVTLGAHHHQTPSVTVDTSVRDVLKALETSEAEHAEAAGCGGARVLEAVSSSRKASVKNLTNWIENFPGIWFMFEVDVWSRKLYIYIHTQDIYVLLIDCLWKMTMIV